MEWYGPMTILPAIALLILSTSNFIIDLNSEIAMLDQSEKKNLDIVDSKLVELKKLGIGISFLYGCVLFFLVAGIVKAISDLDTVFYTLLLLGVVSTTIAIVLLLSHSLKAVYIRQKHLKL
jgi:hypothetical protein